MKKFCTKCGKPFESIGREVICPDCKAQAAEDAKRAAVLKAKKASWNGESVPVRISGRASTVIRAYGAEKSLSFAAALDELLKSTDCFKGMSIKWENIEPYKSRRRDKRTAETQDTQAAGKPQEVKVAAKTTSKPQEVKVAAKTTSKPQEVKVAAKTTSKPQAAKKAASKASASKEVKKAVKTAAGK